MASKVPFQYDTISDAINMIKPGWFLAKVDLKSAYRGVALHPGELRFTGIKWTFTEGRHPEYLIDTRFPFGARKSPEVFHRITQAVKRCMIRRGYQGTLVYLDDFLVAGENFEQCRMAYNTLIYLLRDLGFKIAWNKVCDPCQKLTFIGLVIDTVAGTLSLEPGKVQGLRDEISLFLSRHRASRRQLESLAGRLNWYSNVIPWGPTHLRNVYNLINRLQHPSHKCRISELHQDLLWWDKWLITGNNTRLIWDTRPIITAVTDASNRAGGSFCQNDWLFSDWQSDPPIVA
jgi:hypothetical protein